jgi:hypothetical protein
MKCTNIYLREDHLKKLKAQSEKTGAPVSALIRKANRGISEEEVAGNGMRLTRELTEVVKAEVVSILKGHPAGLKAVQLYSMQWRSFPGRAPSLQEYMDLLRELQTDGTLRERHVPGKFRIWQLGDQTET